MNSRTKGILLLILTAAVGGAIPPVSKIALHEISPIVFTVLRFAVAAAILVPFSIAQKNRLGILSNLSFVSLLATVNIVFFIFGLPRTNASVAQMLYAGVPLLAALISRAMLKEVITTWRIIGVIIGFIGVAGIAALPLFGNAEAQSATILGNLLILVGVVSFSLYSVLSKRLQERYKPMEITVNFIVVTAAVQCILIPFDHTVRNAQFSFSLTSLLSILYVAVIGTGLYYLLYQYAIKQATPLIASMTLYLQPLFTVFWAWLLLGEQLTPGFILGSIFALFGVWLVTWHERPVAALSPTRPHANR